MNLQTLIALRKYISIANHKDNAIKLKYSLRLLADAKVMALIKEARHLDMPKAILESNLNPLTSTVDLKYDPNYIVPSEFEEFLTTKSRPRFEELVEKYKTILSS